MIKKFFSWIEGSLLDVLNDEPGPEEPITTSKNGIELIKKFEGFRAEPYQCSAGVWTIGYGSTFYKGGAKVTKDDKPIFKDEAENLLRHHLARHFEPAIHKLVKVPLNQNQFDALVSFVYNIGNNAFEKSTLLKKLNQGAPKHEVANEFLRWVYANGEKLEGLVNRRSEEKQLFSKCSP